MCYRSYTDGVMQLVLAMSRRIAECDFPVLSSAAAATGKSYVPHGYYQKPGSLGLHLEGGSQKRHQILIFNALEINLHELRLLL